MADVNGQDSLITFEDSDDSTVITSTTFFVPRCIFSQPDPGNIFNRAISLTLNIEDEKFGI